MSEELEVPVEHVQEHIHHEAEHSKAGWISQVALSSAIFAVLAAVAALFAGHHSDEAVIAQINAANQWNYYQAKGIKNDILETRLALLSSEGKTLPAKDVAHGEKLKKDKETSMEKAREYEEESKHHLQTHNMLSFAVTFFQITIAVGAIAALTKRRRYFLVSLALGVVGIVIFIHGFTLHFT